MEVKIMSYNTQHCLNYITRQIDFDLIANTIADCGADIVGLQEMRDQGECEDYKAQAKILAEKLGFYYYFAEAIKVGGNNPYGNALLSRYPIVSAQRIMIPDPEVRECEDGYYETRCVLKATVDVGAKLHVVATHIGLNPDEQRNAVSTILANLPEENCVLMGDFNMEPDDTILEPIRERLYDTAEKFDAPKLSFPSDAPDRKIDYIFTGRDLTVLDADIPAIVSSDHRPHTATIQI